MPITFKCPRKHRLRVPDRHAGKKIRCPKCQAVTQVPEVIQDFEEVDPYDDWGQDDLFDDDYAQPMPGRRSKSKPKPKRKKRSSGSDYANPYAHRPLMSERSSGRRLPRGEYGGIGRLAYFGGGFLLNVFGFLIALGVGPNGGGAIGAALVIIQLVGQMVLVGFRCVNLGMHPLWTLGMLVPCLNLFVGLRCLICPEGYADHGEMDLAGNIISGIVLVLFLLVIGIAVLAAMAGP